MDEPAVLIVLGSDSDFTVMSGCLRQLREFAVRADVRICSAHRSPQQAAELARDARRLGYGVIIAAAGLAAHLPGVLASYTTLPVIGVPIRSGALSGVDALYSIVQMPSGVPVATVAVDGAVNAALLAVQILAVNNRRLENMLSDHKQRLSDSLRERQSKVDRMIEDLT